MNVRSNGTTFFVPAQMQLRRGEDFARGMRSDVTDYRAMLDLAKSRAGADPKRIPNAFRNNLMAGVLKSA